MIQLFGEAYHAFGFSRLMGYIVALLIFSPEPLSLDDIANQLGRSKGPISQITRRLLDKNLIRKVWMPNKRKDYYEIQPDIFANAFKNNFDLIKNNTLIAKQLKAQVEQAEDGAFRVLDHRLAEMRRFYELMEKHYQNFIDEWTQERKRLLTEARRVPTGAKEDS
ncbi:MAG: MarR family transcriptional regulator [candidate division KSB1 bacterium]|nr:MarR family transcriptional regulator [candidate division KSB1 bacterium]MDZ7341625.1 MarR family transcriptional regulator [candidate division KSB1 bacterium]